MKNYKLFFILSAFVISIPIFLSSCSNAPKNNISNRLKLFGVSLQNPNRKALESAIKRAGLIPLREGFNDRCDRYKVTGQLGKASKLYVCYTQNNKFAYAMYAFPASMNAKLMEQYVIAMVLDKYGQPNAIVGDYSQGNVTEYWGFGSNEEIRIFSGLQNATVYLKLINIPHDNRLPYELHNQKEEQIAKKAAKKVKSQGNAF